MYFDVIQLLEPLQTHYGKYLILLHPFGIQFFMQFFYSDICKRIMIERSLQLDTSCSMNTNESRCAARPTDLPTENRRWARHGMYHNTTK